MPFRPKRPFAHAAGGVVLALALPLVLQPAAVMATEWYAEPSLAVGVWYYDNLYLTPSDHESVTGTVITPQLDLGARETHWKANAMARLRAVGYSGDTEPDREEQYYSLTGRYALPRSQFDFSGHYRIDPLRADGIIDPDLGVPLRQTDRESHSVAPSATFRLTELTRLQIGYQHTDVSYAQGTQANLFDYTDQSASLTLSSQLDPRSTVSLVAAFAKYEIPDVRRVVKTASYQLGIDRMLSETTRVSLAAGTRRTVTDDIVTQCTVFFIVCMATEDVQITSRKSGNIFSLGLERTLDRTRLNLNLRRSVQPTGSATQVQADSVTLRLDHSLTPRLKLEAGASGYDYSGIGVSAFDIDRRVYQLSSSLRWRWTEDLSVAAGYTYTEQKYENRVDTATSNAVHLSLRYQWGYWRFSE
jgi:hypothetical protein